jgi:O-antigen chain-terminating methyltransferase
MKRTLEKLNRDRLQKEKSLDRQLQDIKNKLNRRSDDFDQIQESLNAVKDRITRQSEPEGKRSFFLKSRKKSGNKAKDPSVLSSLNKILESIFRQNLETRERVSECVQLIEATAEVMDAKDKEWDALGSNHVGMVFKSLEWKIEKLSDSYEDSNLLMKKFLHIKEELDQLLAVLGKGQSPSPEQVRALAGPLEDFKYAGFENRFRGWEEKVRQQQQDYLPYFTTRLPVLDLGCGRGEFVQLLQDNGIPASGIDVNEQMVDICRDKGLDCRKADIIETLFAQEDNSLGGIFSSQVIEHLSPSYLKRMVELSFFKLAPSGCIILETINPASVFSLVEIYFLDLSHKNPVHPQTLQFLLESSGFKEVKIEYSVQLKEESLRTLPGNTDTDLAMNENIDKLNRLLYAPSNYAAIAVKA